MPPVCPNRKMLGADVALPPWHHPHTQQLSTTSVETSRNQEVASKLAVEDERLRRRWYFCQVGNHLLNEHGVWTTNDFVFFICRRRAECILYRDSHVFRQTRVSITTAVSQHYGGSQTTNVPRVKTGVCRRNISRGPSFASAQAGL